MKKQPTAFATFDGATARAFLYERAEQRLSPLAGFPMAGEKKPAFADARARSFQSTGAARSAIEPQSDPEHRLERQFVADVAARLDGLSRDGAFSRLIVAAGPRALGYWRAVVPKDLAAKVKAELAADYVNTDEATLLPVVEKAFFG